MPGAASPVQQPQPNTPPSNKPIDDLEKNSDFQRLPSYQQQELRDYVNNGGNPTTSPSTTAADRSKITAELSWSIAEADQTDNKVGDVFIEKLKNKPVVVADLEAFAQLSYFDKILIGLEGPATPATGQTLITSQRQLLQVIAELSNFAKASLIPQQVSY